MSAKAKKPSVAIVGAGRVGRAVARLLRQRGWPIGVVVARSLPSARAAVRVIGAGPARAGIVPGVLEADVILIAVPDAAIPSVAAELAGMSHTSHLRTGVMSGRSLDSKSGGSNINWRGKVVLHTCGAFHRSVLRPLERRGADTGSLHPLQTFSGRSAPNLAGCACAIDGNRAALAVARRICKELGCFPVRVLPAARPAYHAAAVLAAGHVLASVESATRMLMAIGFSRRKALRALLPLTRETLSNLERFGAPQSWIGPAARGDMQTVQKHLAALSRFPREYRQAYAALTRLGLLLLAKKPRRARKR